MQDLIDIFSFGHLGLFVLVQEFPSTKLLPPTYQDAEGNIIGYSDVKRREKYFAKIPPNAEILGLNAYTSWTNGKEDSSLHTRWMVDKERQSLAWPSCTKVQFRE